MDHHESHVPSPVDYKNFFFSVRESTSPLVSPVYLTFFFHISSLHCTPKIYSKQNFQSSAQTNLHLTFTPKSFTCTRILLLFPCLFVCLYVLVCVCLFEPILPYYFISLCCVAVQCIVPTSECYITIFFVLLSSSYHIIKVIKLIYIYSFIFFLFP